MACMTARITFYGGAGTVTGANFLFEAAGKKILVDCGARDRENICDKANHQPFKYDAKSIDVLVITHAHQDHIGLVPKLVREGFTGIIYSTPATHELSEIMLADALKIMNMDAQRSGCPVLFEGPDVERALSLWQSHDYHEPFSIGDVQVEFLNAGHILGSAMVKMTRAGSGQNFSLSGTFAQTVQGKVLSATSHHSESGGSEVGSVSQAVEPRGSAGPAGPDSDSQAHFSRRAVIFTGDLGNNPEPLLRDTDSAEGANYLVMESVYGDKVHEGRDDRRDQLKKAIDDARKRGGTLLVPCFSLERTQIILFELHQMIESGELQPIPVYLDSPLAERVMGVFRKYTNLFNDEAQKVFAHSDGFSFPKFVDVHNTAESHSLHKKADPKVIIAGAGMSNGGRIRDHEKVYLPDPKAAVLFTGYQAAGSLGRRIQDGANEVVIDREHIKVRATVSALSGYSGHKDRDGLVDFAASAGETLEKVFVVMGEPKASNFLAQRIGDFLGVKTEVPQIGDNVEIEW